MNTGNKILVVCHDAGGAEIVSAYVKKNWDKYNFVCFVQGPAIKVFKRKKIKAIVLSKKNIIDFKKIFLKHKNAIKLITGTSWASLVELNFIHQAKLIGIKTISYLDHWVNFRERFGYPKKYWKNNLPDEIWVGDKIAFKIAKKYFTDLSVRLVPNLYFKEIEDEMKKNKKIELDKSSKNILFIGDALILKTLNLIGDKSSLLIDEFGIIKKIISIMVKNRIKSNLILRPHPLENKNKYNAFINRNSGKVKLEQSHSGSLALDLAGARLVIGTESMALVVAYLLGKKVININPWKGRVSGLPFNMVMVKDIKNLELIMIKALET